MGKPGIPEPRMLYRIAVVATAFSSLASGQSSFRPLPRAALVARPAEANLALPAEPFQPGGSEVDSLPTLRRGPASAELPDISLDLFAHADLDGTFEGGGSELETRRGGWRARIEDTDDSRTIAFEGGVEGTFYQFSGAPPLGSLTTDPFNDLYRTWVGASYSTRPELGHVGAFGGVEATFGGEDEVGSTAGLTVGGLAGLHYRAAENLTLSAGLAGTSRLEDEARLWPFLGFDWAMTDSWDLSILGPDIELGLRLNQRWRGYVEAAYDLRQYRLNDGGPAQGAAFRDEAVRLGSGLEYSPSPSVRLSLDAGISMWRELSLHETDGSSSEVEIDPAPYVGVQLRFGF